MHRVIAARKHACLLSALLLSTGLLSGCGSTAKPDARASGECSYPTAGTPAKKVAKPPATPAADAPSEVTIATNQGNIKVALDADKVPCTVNSFLHLADNGYFDDTACHRLVTSGIMVLQCGDPSATGTGGPGYRFADELLDPDPRLTDCGERQTTQGTVTMCTYPAGTVAMANAGPDTNGSQFFLVYADSPLPPAYTVFGRMSAGGLGVVEKIAKAGNGPDGVAPATATRITSIS